MSKYYVKIFYSWLDYEEWIKTFTEEIVSVGVDCGKVLVTIKYNNKLNEGN